MFTGIIESLGKITEIEKEGENYHFTRENVESCKNPFQRESFYLSSERSI